MKTKRLMALVIAVLTLTMAFAPAALATTYAPYNWSSWPIQKTSSYDTGFTCSLQRVIHDHFSLQHTNSSNSDTYFTVDGIFGANTKAWVKKFQDRHDLSVDGIVGSNTWSKLKNCISWSYGVGDADVYRVRKHGSSALCTNDAFICSYKDGEWRGWTVYIFSSPYAYDLYV